MPSRARLPPRPESGCRPRRSMSCGASSTLLSVIVLVCRVGSFNLRQTRHVVVLGAGILIMSLMLARAFGRFHGGL